MSTHVLITLTKRNIADVLLLSSVLLRIVLLRVHALEICLISFMREEVIMSKRSKRRGGAKTTTDSEVINTICEAVIP